MVSQYIFEFVYIQRSNIFFLLCDIPKSLSYQKKRPAKARDDNIIEIKTTFKIHLKMFLLINQRNLRPVKMFLP